MKWKPVELTLILAIIFGTALSLQCQTPRDTESGPLYKIVNEALENNPGLNAQRKKVMAAMERPSKAGSFPDPTADIQFMMLPVEGSFSAKNALTRGVSLGVTQRIPYHGKLKLRRERAERRAGVQRIQLKAMESNLRAEVISASYRYALYRGLLEINSNIQDALKAASTGAAGVYASGNGSQADVLLAQVALTKSKADRKGIEKQLEVVLARLEDLLGGPVDRTLLDRVEVPALAPLPTLYTIIGKIQEEAPMVLKARAEIAVNAKQVELARKDFKPDFIVGGRYRHNDMTMDGRDYLTAMVGITLPFFHRKNRYKPALQEALYMQESAKEQATDTLNKAMYMVTEAYQAGIQDNEVYNLYKDGLLIQSKKAYESALSSYTVGGVDFTTMLKALTNYFDYQSQALMFKTDYGVSISQIEAVLGGPMPTDTETVK